jgi:hypothetical protein
VPLNSLHQVVQCINNIICSRSPRCLVLPPRVVITRDPRAVSITPKVTVQLEYTRVAHQLRIGARVMVCQNRTKVVPQDTHHSNTTSKGLSLNSIKGMWCRGFHWSKSPSLATQRESLTTLTVVHRCNNTWWKSSLSLLTKWTCITTINRWGNLCIIPNTLKTYLNTAKLMKSRQGQVLSQRHPRAEKKLTGRCLLTRPSLMVDSLQVSSVLSMKMLASSISSSRCWAISWIKISNISIRPRHYSSSPTQTFMGLSPTLLLQILRNNNSNSRASCREVYRP